MGTPFGVEARTVRKRFLSSDAGRGQSGIKIRAADGFCFWHSFGKKYGEASDECVARATAVDAVDCKGGDVMGSCLASEKRSIGSESDDHAANAAEPRVCWHIALRLLRFAPLSP